VQQDEAAQHHASTPSALHPALRAAADDIIKERTGRLERMLAELAAPLAGTTSVVVGGPSETIVHEAAYGNADLSSLAHAAWRKVTRLLLGSVSEQVLRNADCPVLIVKRPRR
jgi:nucleotide-binding universal stress UspA family protein